MKTNTAVTTKTYDQKHSELTHHTNDFTLTTLYGFGYVQSTAPKFMM